MSEEKTNPEIDPEKVRPTSQATFDYSKAEVLLDVRHLKQYFKFGSGQFKYNKAVHDVSFQVYKGEVFGLVGESGCGKTTTGRAIIRLYQPTSGSVYFKGTRINAGTRWNEKEIKYTKIRLKKKLAELSQSEKEEIAAADAASYDDKSAHDEAVLQIKNRYHSQRESAIQAADAIISTQREKIHSARYDTKNCDKEYCAKAMKEVQAKYADLLTKCANGRNLGVLSEEEKKTYQTYLAEFNHAKHAKITLGMQMIFQDPIASLNPRMTVRDIIAEGLKINGVHDKKLINDRVNEMLKLVGLLPEHAERYPHEFSGGQRQRIGIARALIMNPDLIVADEPVSALDVSIQAQIINLLNDLRNQLGLTIVFIAHNLSVVKYFCDRIAVMYYGRLVELATSDELFLHPLHPYTISLLSAVPHPDPIFEKSRKRLIYDPKTAHDYSADKPRIVEIAPGHFVYCNLAEEKKYRDLLASGYHSE